MSPSALIPVQNGMSRVPRSTSSCVSVQMPGHGVVMASARALLTDWAQVARESRAALDPASLRLDQGALKTDGTNNTQRASRAPGSATNVETHNHSTISDLVSEAPLYYE